MHLNLAEAQARNTAHLLRRPALPAYAVLGADLAAGQVLSHGSPVCSVSYPNSSLVTVLLSDGGTRTYRRDLPVLLSPTHHH